MTKAITLNSCRECPNSAYYSGGSYVCTKMQGANHIPGWYIGEMPPWCPLPDYPAVQSPDGVDSVDLSEQGRNRSAVLGNTMQALTEGGVPFVKALDATLKAFDHPPAPDGVKTPDGGQGK